MRRGSLATKLAIAITLLVVLSAGAVGGLALTASQQTVREHVLGGNVAAARLTARAVEQYVADAVAIMQEAPGRPKLGREIAAANWPEAATVLENFHRNFTQFDYVFVQDARGVIRVRIPYADTVGQDFSFRHFFQDAVRTRALVVSPVYTSRAVQRSVVSIAVPILAGGEIKGVLVGALSLHALGELVSTIAGSERVRVLVVDRTGAVVALAGDDEPESPEAVRSLSSVQAALAGRAGAMEYAGRRRPGPFLGGYVPIPRLGWGVVVDQPAKVAFAASARLRRWLLGVAAGSAVLAVLLGVWQARSLTRPLARLVRATEGVAAGDLGVRVTVEGRDEVAALAGSFNAMTERLQASYGELTRKSREIEALNVGLEQQVAERTHQLAAVNRELESFTYTVSHDLKAPLRGMTGFARALKEDFGDRLDPEAHRYLDMIERSARQMGALIDDLLRYSRLERRAMNRGVVELKPIVQAVLDDLHDEIEARRLEVVLALEAPTVDGEREGVREALGNLVGNAVKFTGTGGTLTITARRDGAGVTIAVADTGIGFDMAYHDRIFGIFERLHRQEDYPGTGVGLAIVRRVAERHGGRAWATSEPGKGSIFYLELPERGRT